MGIKECLASYDTVGQLCEETLSQINQRICSLGSLFFLSQDGRSFDFKSAVRKDISDESYQAYIDYYHKMDPFAAAILSGTITEPVLTEQIVPWNKFVGTRYYREFMRRIAFRQAITIPLFSKTGLMGNIILFSPPNTVFSTDELSKACALQPIIELTLEKTLALEKIAQQACMLRFLLDQEKQKGIMVLDSSLVPIYQNERARESIKRCYDKNYDGLKLPKAFEGCLERKIYSEDHLAFTVQPDPSIDFRVSASRLPYPEGKDCYLLFFEFIRPSMEVLRKIGISKRECEVISLLCEGFKNGQIAEKLFISEATVENHLSRIYEKTGVNNRTCLAHRVHLLMEGHPL